MFKAIILIATVGAALYGFADDLAAYMHNQMDPMFFWMLTAARFAGTVFVMARIHGEVTVENFDFSDDWVRYFLGGLLCNAYFVPGLRAIAHLFDFFSKRQANPLAFI